MDRRYTDREVSLILQRALEPGGEPGLLESGEGGLSLAQIKDIATEVGIDAHRIELAASALLEPTPARANPYAGIPTTVQFETTVRGVHVDDILHHDVLGAIRGTLGRQGIVSGEFGALEWKARDAMGGRYVSVTPSDEGVRLRVLGNYRDGLFAMLALLGATGFFATGFLASLADLGLLSGLAGLAGASILPRFGYRWWRKREDATMAKVHGKLTALLQTAASSHAAAAPEALEAGEEPADDASADPRRLSAADDSPGG